MRLPQRVGVPVTGMGDRDGQRVGGVRDAELRLRQKEADHRLDLHLLGVAGARHGLLDQVGGVLEHRQAGEGRHEQRHRPRVAQLERRLGVLVDEGLLHGDLVGPHGLDDAADPLEQLPQAQGQRKLPVRGHDPAIAVGELRTLRGDQAPAGAAESGIDAENADGAGHGAPRLGERPEAAVRIVNAWFHQGSGRGGCHLWPSRHGALPRRCHPRRPRRISAVPARQTALPARSQRSGRWPSASHSHRTEAAT